MPDGKYGRKESWDGLNISRNWFLNTKDGKKVFLVEADSTEG